jgi:hypothetical protein
VKNTVNLYWLALAFAAIVIFAMHRIADAPAGRVLAAVRDDDRRVGVVGLDPYRFRLFAFVASAATAAAGGAVYALLVGGASPHVAASDLTLSLLVMVVLGRAGHALGPGAGRSAVRVPRPPADRGRVVRRGGRPAQCPVRTVVPAAVHPGHGVHPGRLLLPGRAGRTTLPPARLRRSVT